MLYDHALSRYWFAASRVGFVAVARNQRYLYQVRHLPVDCEIPHLHAFGHPLAKRCHGKLLCEMECAASSGSIVSQKSSWEKRCKQGGLNRRYPRPQHAGTNKYRRSGLVQEILRERVKAGIGQARAKGTTFGRPKSAAKKSAEIRRLYRKEKLSKSEIARQLGIGRTSVPRLLENS